MYNSGMSHSKSANSWRFSIRGLLMATAGIALSLYLFRWGDQLAGERMFAGSVFAAGAIVLGGTIGSFLGYSMFRTDGAGANGFVLGAIIAVLFALLIPTL
jgi:hypothetical protein